jgi:hypothetical protein
VVVVAQKVVERDKMAVPVEAVVTRPAGLEYLDKVTLVAQDRETMVLEAVAVPEQPVRVALQTVLGEMVCNG